MYIDKILYASSDCVYQEIPKNNTLLDTPLHPLSCLWVGPVSENW